MADVYIGKPPPVVERGRKEIEACKRRGEGAWGPENQRATLTHKDSLYSPPLPEEEEDSTFSLLFLFGFTVLLHSRSSAHSLPIQFQGFGFKRFSFGVWLR
ncbi:hypothetical protein PanWU01x14_325350 [Parasponia andersonii]|uniref:Uncharacterized protein n=1 Tax=Parasponia andersonii TaxID=3476 RepID=A0A2P5AJU6_PARAD|nr:hypothetical protein PanWU01x14_325350 [Parasponia andersonii]